MIKTEHTVFALPFALMSALLAYLFLREGLGITGLTGLGIVAALIAHEHSLVRPSDLSRINAAFFTLNGWISFLLLVTTGIDLFWKKIS